MLWGELVNDDYLKGRDLEHWQRSEAVRGPIKSVTFNADGHLVVILDWAGTSLALSGEDPEWEDAGADTRYVFPNVRFETVVRGFNHLEAKNWTEELIPQLATNEWIKIHCPGDNIRRPPRR